MHDFHMPDRSAKKEPFDAGQFSSGMESLSRSLKAAFAILAILIVGMLIWFFTFGGFFIVSPQESVIVLRFGEFSGQYDESWHWVFPFPVNTIVRVPRSVQSIRTSSFLPDNRTLITDRKQSAMMGGEGGGPLVPGKDGYLLTGDANIIHTEWEMTYNVTDPKTYFEKCLTPESPAAFDEVLKGPKGEILGSRGPRTLLKAQLDNCVIKVTATWSAEGALYSKRASEYVKAVESMMKRKVDEMELGLHVESVSLRLKSPPPQTIAAFEDVIVAEQQGDSERQKANAYAVEQLNTAESERAVILSDASSYKRRVVEEVSADKSYFEKILKEYSKNPDSMLTVLYSNSLAESMDKVKDKFVISRLEGDKQEVRLKLTPDLPPLKKKEEVQMEAQP